MAHESDRRSFLSWATLGLGAIFSTILGVPVVCYFIDPRHRQGPKSSFKLVEGIKIDELARDSPPRQGVIRDVRVDGWTLYPNDVIGRVWVVAREALPDLSSADKVTDFNKRDQTEKDRFLHVFTTICPHLGCFVNLNNAGNGFACPCHSATFNIDGARAAESNPAKRGMDTLDWEIDPLDRNRLYVKYKKFKTLEEKKESVGGEQA